MIFITLDDIKLRVKDNILDDLVSKDNRILDLAETDAINCIRSFCNNKYDIDFELKQIEGRRNTELISFITDHMLYDLYSRISVNEVGDVREMRYEVLMKKLKATQKGEYVPSFKTKDYDLDETAAPSLLGSNRRQNYSIW